MQIMLLPLIRRKLFFVLAERYFDAIIYLSTRCDESMAKNEELRKENIQRIRTCFYQGGSWTKNTLAEAAGLSLAGTTNVLQDLLASKEILYEGDGASTGGRRSKVYRLNPETAHIGILDCHHRNSQYSFKLQEVNLNNEVINENTLISPDGSMKDFAKAVKLLCQRENVKFIAVSIPGVCQQGSVTSCDFPLLAGKDLGKIIGKTGNVPYAIENDVNTACISVAHHDLQMQDIALIYQPQNDYIGCGIIINGKLYNGAHHEAGEMKNLSSHRQSALIELKNTIASLKAVMDPQKIFWCSDLIRQIKDTDEDLIHLEDIDAEIQHGLFEIGRYQLLMRKKEEDL